MKIRKALGAIKWELIKWLRVQKQNIQIILKSRNDKIIFYFGVPQHPNMGDLAQCMCIRDFFRRFYPEYTVIEIDTKVYMNQQYSQRRLLHKVINKQDYIFFQSGYCTQDLGGIEDLMHQAVMQEFPDNRLVMLPQTVFFQSKERRMQASAVYSAHEHLLFLARDSVSFQIAKDLFHDTPIIAFPDIVTTLIGKYHFDTERKGILFCLRNDEEKFYSAEVLDRLREQISKFESCNTIDTTIRKSVIEIHKNLTFEIESFIAQFANYRLVITDRYHGTIFSAVAETPVIVIKTTDHKVKTGVDWFADIMSDRVRYIDDINQVPEVAKQMLNSPFPHMKAPYFENTYYKNLRQMVEATLK